MQGTCFNHYLWLIQLTTKISQFRQIPDNQEVFVDMNTQQSLIFELLEQVEATNEQVAK